MLVKELRNILENYNEDAEVIGVDWSNGQQFDICVGDDDENENVCCISFN